MNTPVHNAILVFHAAGIVHHRFCEAEEAMNFVNEPANRGCSVFTYENVNAEDIYKISPKARDRVDSAKAKLRSDLRIKGALDKHGVTPDIDVRVALHEAFSELRFQTVRQALADAGAYSLSDVDAFSRNADARLEHALNNCGVLLEGTTRQAVKGAFQELLAN